MTPAPAGHSVKTWVRFFAFVLSVALAALFAQSLAGFVASDACVDAGGRYETATGACSGVTDHVAPFSRPGNTVFWIVFLAPVMGMFAAAYLLASKALDRVLWNGNVEIGGTPRDGNGANA